MKPLNLIKERLSVWLLETVLKVSGWFMTVNFTKVVAVLTVSCFLLTSVMGHAVSAVLETARETKHFNQAIDNFVIPHTLGRITDGKYFGSDQIVINIQDLHCHAEVQRNINKILSLLDEKYKLKDVFLEGAWTNVDTSWLYAVSDKTVRQKLVDSLTDQGRLTGAEYYSVVSGKTNLIKGLEKKDLYFENFRRLNKIIGSQTDVKNILSQIGSDITRLKDTYYNKDQKQLEYMVKRYKDGKLEAKKYYRLLDKFSEKLDVDIYGYHNIIGYINLIDRERKLDYKRIAAELQQFVGVIKQKLPYAAYRELLEKTDNFSKVDKVYTYLQNLAREYNINLAHSLPELNSFFEYVDASQKVNPVDLVSEEKMLVGVLEMKLGRNQSQNDVAFMVDFFRYFEDYLENKISADDYAYFTANSDKFKLMWVRYIDNYKMSMLAPYLKTCDEFYKANLERNEYFVKTILGETPKISLNLEYDSPYIADSEKALLSLQKAKSIKVVVTGGFHTAGISKLLEKQKVSYLVITPNVTQDTKLSQELYDKIAKEESKYLFQAFELPNLSNLSVEERQELIEAVNAAVSPLLIGKSLTDAQVVEAINKIFEKKNVTFDIKKEGKGYRFTWTYTVSGATVEGTYINGEVNYQLKEAAAKASEMSKENRAKAKKIIPAGVYGFIEAILLPIIISQIVAWGALWFLAFGLVALLPLLLVRYFFLNFRSVETVIGEAGELVKADMAGKIETPEAAKERLANERKGVAAKTTGLLATEGISLRPGMHLASGTPEMVDIVDIRKNAEGDLSIWYTAVDKKGNRIRTKTPVSLGDYKKATLDDLSDLAAEVDVGETKSFKVMYHNVRLIEKIKLIAGNKVDIVKRLDLHAMRHFKFKAFAAKHAWFRVLFGWAEEWIVSLGDALDYWPIAKSKEAIKKEITPWPKN